MVGAQHIEKMPAQCIETAMQHLLLVAEAFCVISIAIHGLRCRLRD